MQSCYQPSSELHFFFTEKIAVILVRRSNLSLGKANRHITNSNKFSVFFGIFLVSMLFVPPGIPFMVPEAEAAYGEVPNPVTDLTITHPPGTIIEWDLDYNALCSVHNVCPSSFHELQIYVNKYVMTGNQEFLCFFQEDATPTTTCDPGMFQLVRQGNWDYKLYVNTGTAAANGNVLA